MIEIPPEVLSRFLTQAALLRLAPARQHGLNPFQVLTLALIGGTEWLSFKEVRSSLAMPRSTFFFTVDSLRKKELIDTRQSTKDRRQLFLNLSPKGRELYQRMLETEARTILPVIEGLNETQKAAFLKATKAVMRTARVPGKFVSS